MGSKDLQKFDGRKAYHAGIDTETCNGIMEGEKLNLDYSLVYDIGYAIVDKKGRVLHDENGKPVERSFVIYEIFVGMADVMKSAYYASKIPLYWEDIKNGNRKLVRFMTAWNQFREDVNKYGVKAIFAHNARFDYKALNNTLRYITGSRFRYFFPKGVEIWDTLKMARDTICKQKSYISFCIKNGFLTARGAVRATAEVLYAYITNNPNYSECHTGLEDVKIESQIFAWCIKQHKKMRKLLWEPKPAIA